MLFNSLKFLIFLPIVFLLYWFVFDYLLRKSRYQLSLQNLFILSASYYFYGCWSWRFLCLIIFTTLCSFVSGILIENFHAKNNQRAAIAALVANVVVNLLILGVFKYYDFFVSSFARLLGMSSEGMLLHLVLPVGISFYTFQALSYSIDVYRRQICATHNVVAFAAFLAFFPQLVAGPIERAANLLPQFLRKRSFDYSMAVEGMRYILWGYFLKIVIADNCATYVDAVWSAYSIQNASTLWLAAALFSLQIYGDFAGYSNIAIGVARLFGISLKRNFDVPYFSRDIAEFWRRWHISLTTWFRDYVYIPLGGSRPVVPSSAKHPMEYAKALIVRNTFVIFLLSGIWHGANWTFIAWGGYHALLFLPLIMLGLNRRHRGVVASNEFEGKIKLHLFPTPLEFGQMVLTFILALVGWVIFRSATIADAWSYIQHMCAPSVFAVPYIISKSWMQRMALSVAVMFIIEWLNRDNGGILSFASLRLPKWLRWLIYLSVCSIIWHFGNFSYAQFIYFQF